MRQPCRASSLRRCARNAVRPRAGTASTLCVVIAFLVAGAGFDTRCHAAPEDEEEGAEALTVAYEAADLTDPARARKLLRRLDAAVLRACGAMNGIGLPVRDAIERSECHRIGLARSTTSLESPILTRLAQDLAGYYGLKQEAP
ncbi:UrcA family protein [Swaminathania salitolerans]|uniref:UrcA family protein n=1 Tax=Swaminathania salitolerans TaxID=182838 RepID=A0A511BTQ7_9PROT|nr:UrcA family protein [Swaminathania salitolerans]GBQ12802.1 hypothetical protein AA21291_1305 [Swaminathania salitolerans LMG 21291]GEL03173.1 hypothetical protein SSA02_23360 [Swaminathania salitolerans]